MNTKKILAAAALAACCAGTAATAGGIVYFLMFQRPHLSYIAPQKLPLCYLADVGTWQH